MKKLFIILITVFFCSTAHAANWNVDGGGADNCVADGNCQTIQAAITAAASGDSIYIADGTYSESIDFVASSTKNLTIAAVDFGNVIIDSDNVQNKTIKQYAGNQTWNGIIFDGQAANTRILYFHPSSAGTKAFNSCTFQDTGVGKALTSGLLTDIATSASVSFVSCTFSLTYSHLKGVYMTPESTGDLTVDQCTISYPKVTEGYSFFHTRGTNDNITFINNTVTSSAIDAAYGILNINGTTKNILVQNNATTSATTSASGTYEHYDLSSKASLSSCLVSQNTMTAHHTAGHVLLVGTESNDATRNDMSSGAIIENNNIWGPRSGSNHGLMFGFSSNGIIRNNRVEGLGYGIVIKGEGQGGTKAYNNIVIDSTAECGLHFKGVVNCAGYNNTIYQDASNSVTEALCYIHSSNGNNASNITLRNNLFLTDGTEKFIEISSGSQTGFDSDYNLFYTSSYTDKFDIAGTTYSNLTWLYDSNSVYDDPLLSDKSSDYLYPSSLSPAIGAGADFVNPTGLMYTTEWPDYVIEYRRSIPADIGAYEFPGS